MKEVKARTKRGVLLDGALFDSAKGAKTAMISITGIHGNFYSNPFYYNFGDTLNSGGIDFIYAQTCDAFDKTLALNVLTGREELIGSFNERFKYAVQGVGGWVDFAEAGGYENIVLGGHSLGANKVINYLSQINDERVNQFFMLSPANLTYMMRDVSQREKQLIKYMYENGQAGEMLPFYFMGWVACIAATGYDWAFSGILNNVHTEKDGDFAQVEKIRKSGALLIGTYDNFTCGDPSKFLANINNHMPSKDENELIFIEQTGHTYQGKAQETADAILTALKSWGY